MCVDGKGEANWRSPKAVRMEMMLLSWEKSRLRDWVTGKVAVLLVRVVLIWACGEERVW